MDYHRKIESVYKGRDRGATFLNGFKRLAVLFAFFVILINLLPLPQPLFSTHYSTVLQSENGTLIGARISSDGQWRFPLPDSIPQKFKQAILAFEDEYFYFHPGINPGSLWRAFIQNQKAGKVISGGSTISMQVIRLAMGNPNRTYAQKALEMLLALKLEFSYSKDEILSQYTAHAPFGGNVVGLSAASWRYFGRPAHKLSWAETASLAVLPNDPSAVFPGKNIDRFKQKRDRLLDKLLALGSISEEENTLSKAEPVPGIVKPLPDHAYHLTQRAISEGYSETIITTTIQNELQLMVSEKVNRYHQVLEENEIHNAAAIVLDIETGHVKAYVGNVTSTQADHGQHVDMILATRSPGSLLKPVLYAAAIDEGLILPGQLLPDIPMFYMGFTPQNFDKNFRGAVKADIALASSLNVPFVHLLKEFGYEKLHQKLTQMGITSLNHPPGHYGLSLVLGGADCSLWDMTALYAGMARALFHFEDRPFHQEYSNSDYHPNHYIPLKNEKKAPLKDHGYLSATSIRATFEAMQQLRRPENDVGWQLFGSSRPIYWKSGTSHGFKDAWAIGLNNRYVVGVWVGNADGEGRPDLIGVRAASPLMFDIFDLLEGDASLPPPMGDKVEICTKSGMLTSKYCSETTFIQLPSTMHDGARCPFHLNLHLDTTATYQVNSECYPVSEMVQHTWFVLPAVQSWYFRRIHADYIEPPPIKPGCSGGVQTNFMEMIYPRQFTRVYVPIEQDGQPGLTVFEAAHRTPGTTIFWHLDDQYVGSTSAFHQLGLNPNTGTHKITLVDEFGNELQQVFEVIN